MPYWLTPPELEYLREGRFDPTPYPHGFGDRNALLSPWKKPWYCNPPFNQATRFVRKGILEGGPGIFVIPVTTPTYLLLMADAMLKPLGKVRWLDTITRVPMPNGVLCVAAELKAREREDG